MATNCVGADDAMDSIRCLAAWVMALLEPCRPASGWRPYPTPVSAVAAPWGAVPVVVRPAVPSPSAVPVWEPWDGSDPDPVRPYVVVYEAERWREDERERQAERRRALWFATLGMDVEPLRVHRAGAGAR